ncbi:hypothetical protein BpHYR1_009612 [Brachionus plicatilis]|uniref:Uncharacterized protein n=1 Tax=Brachionus plicatilis TaxID=10195 RepID=A0A3M7T5R8_BRAPC|nr:hypothetical protein BpHYR1_009612 [Brachionus plicatilis]
MIHFGFAPLLKNLNQFTALMTFIRDELPRLRENGSSTKTDGVKNYFFNLFFSICFETIKSGFFKIVKIHMRLKPIKSNASFAPLD